MTFHGMTTTPGSDLKADRLIYTPEETLAIQKFLVMFMNDTVQRTESQFMELLDKFY